MKVICMSLAMVALCAMSAAGQVKTLTTDPLTGLPLIPTTDAPMHLGNAPMALPDATVCKSKMKGNFYSIYGPSAKSNPTAAETAAWYASHLTGFKRVHGDTPRSQDVFYNAARTILVIVTGTAPEAGQKPSAYSVAYERFEPGLSPKTIVGITQGNIACQ